MEKIKVEHLDIPIIRSCNLACVGCMTHSNHKNIKGIVRVNESIHWLEFWSAKLQPKAITLFGGEPLLHPEFTEWAQTVRRIWGPTVPVSLNTNGYYLDTLLDHIPLLFSDNSPTDIAMSMVVSYQTATEPYLSKVTNSFENLKQKVLEYYLSLPGVTSAKWNLWLDEKDINTKQWFNLVVNGRSTRIGFTTCEQHKLHWCKHYDGYAEEMHPVYDYNDTWYESNFKSCQTNDFITLYRGKMWKCPPMGVLEHTLNTFNIQDRADWAPFLNEYKTVSPDSTDEEIQAWFSRTLTPEKVCNMCGFNGPSGGSITGEDRSHILKNYWKYTL
jgi:organic radical activating enzyme